MSSAPDLIVILGTGGTIAGASTDASDNVGYRAGQIGVSQLVVAVPALAARRLEAEQVAQVDSKDMDHAVWQALARRVAHHLGRPEVAGVVITHGTDTLEETAYFLHRVLAPAKPVVLTAAMRPATALMADGPQNLLDAVCVAAEPGAAGVVAALAGQVHGAEDLRKQHPYRVDAFDSGEAGPLALVQEGRLRRLRAWPRAEPRVTAALEVAAQDWPRVDIVSSHAGVRGDLVAALRALGARGLVVEGTGNGTVHQALEGPLQQAREAGVPVLRASRCTGGAVVGSPPGALPSAGGLTPAKARIELMLQLLAPPA